MSVPRSIDILAGVLAHTPAYVWLLLAAALMLGARRLKPKRTHFAVAALPPALFMLLGLWFAASMKSHFFYVAAVWGASFVLGAATSSLRLVARPKPVTGLLIDFAPSAVPITAYLCIFSAHYALGIWGGLVPDLSVRLSLMALAISGLTAGRTAADLLLILQDCWRSAAPPSAGEAREIRLGCAGWPRAETEGCMQSCSCTWPLEGGAAFRNEHSVNGGP
jgi:hypothetical protein